VRSITKNKRKQKKKGYRKGEKRKKEATIPLIVSMGQTLTAASTTTGQSGCTIEFEIYGEKLVIGMM
jgi:hypothetical protein